MDLTKITDANALCTLHESRFNGIWLLESLCVLGMNTVNIWESIVKNLKTFINKSDPEMSSIYKDLNVVFEYLKCNVGMDENSQLKFLAERDYKFSFQELNVFLENWDDTIKIKIKIFSPQASYSVIQIILSILYQQQTKQKQFKSISKITCISGYSSDSSDDEFNKLFKIKNEDVVIKQLLQLNSDKKNEVMRSPRKTGSYLIKIEMTDMKDLINIPKKQYWTKVYKKVDCILHENEAESENIIHSINYILLKVGNKLSKIPNVQIQVYKNNRDINIYS